MKIPFNQFARHHAALAGELAAAVDRVFRSGWYILGPELAELERQVAARVGVRHAIGVGSGTDALTLALRAAGIRPGDEVIVPALTAIPTAAAVVAAGATPVFADIEPATGALDPAAAAAAVTPRTRALIPVHLYGQCADVERLGDLARERGLAMIEDAAQAFGARRHGRPAGSFGAAGCFSFYPTKNLGACGDAGMVVTDRDDLAAALRQLRNYGQVHRYRAEGPGVNSRLDELQAAILLAKLGHLDGWNARRRELAARYAARLAAPGLALPMTAAGNEHIHHLFVIRHPRRDDLQRFLADHQVETLIHYPFPLHRQPAFAAFARGECPRAAAACREILSLPLVPELTGPEQDRVIALINSFA